MPGIEKKAIDSVIIDNSCIKCRMCVQICPMNNLEYNNGKIIHKSNCTLCYRCVNKCPRKAIKVFLHAKVKQQYEGLKHNGNSKDL